MDSKNILMQEIFNKLTEKNKDILILIAKSVKVAQEDVQCNSSKQTAV